ncbi:MAG: hypothetical protein KGL39_31205 [Patescibacteria group bacterium]|nr:hypothetical protein [Patescibacteria group bacterium]
MEEHPQPLRSEAHIHARAMLVCVDNFEVHGAGVTPVTPVVGQNCTVLLDGQELKGWKSLTIELTPHGTARIRVDLSSLVQLRGEAVDE